MPASGSTFLGKGFQRLLESGANRIDWDDAAQNIYAMLVTEGFTQPLGAADLDGLETLDSTLAAGGTVASKKALNSVDAALTTRTISLEASLDKLILKIPTLFFTILSAQSGGPGTQGRGIIFYRDVGGTNATKYILGFMKFSADLPLNGSDVKVTPPAAPTSGAIIGEFSYA